MGQELSSLVQVVAAEDAVVPPNRIPPRSQNISPSMLSMVLLDTEQIEQIVRVVPGGATNIQDIYPLAAEQETALVGHPLHDQGEDAHPLSILLSVTSQQRIQELVVALQSVIDRHDILRTAVLSQSLPQPVQVVQRNAVLPVLRDTLKVGADVLERVKDWMLTRRQTMALHEAPLMRLWVARDPEETQHYALLELHPIICDAIAAKSLLAEAVSHLQNHGNRLPMPLPYRNHVAQSLMYARTHDPEEFFRKKLVGVDEQLAPFGLVDANSSYALTERAEEELESALAEQIRLQARHVDASTEALFHAAWAIVVALTSGCKDVIIGCELGRRHDGEGPQHSLGTLSNTLPLRLDVKGATANELVRRAHQELVDLLRHRRASCAAAHRSRGGNGSAPLFTTVISYRNVASKGEADWAYADGIQVLASQQWSACPIVVVVDDSGTDFRLTAHTDGRIDPRRITGYLHTAMQSLVQVLERAPQSAALSLAILNECEQRQVVEQFNATFAGYPQDKLVNELFEEQAERTPDSVAAVYEEQSLTYAQLNVQRNELSRRLLNLGVMPGDRVAICVDRGLQMIVGILGILRSGAAYVPLDPSYPTERLRYMLQDSSPRVLLTQEHLKGLISQAPSILLVLDSASNSPGKLEPTDPVASVPKLQRSHPAYVIYTSGSTGQPKGVVVSHGNLLNLIHTHVRNCAFTAKDTVLQFASMSFDASVEEIFPPLTVGAKVVIRPPWVTTPDADFLRLLRSHRITVADLPTAFWHQWAQYDWQNSDQGIVLRLVVIGGEKAERPQWERWRTGCWGSQCHWLNTYGPTEATVYATALSVKAAGQLPEGEITIGRPVANAQIYILGEQLQPLPIGVTGEIYIGGAGVVSGYLNRPQLTAERFLADPFAHETAGARVYRTGDLGRWRSDGTIEYLGRNDAQVKIRGFRIELGEIEAQLQRHEQVAEAVVLAREDNTGSKILTAYIVLRNTNTQEGPLTRPQLRAHVGSRLPSHMVPSAIVFLERLPLTASGKIDRRALPRPAAEAYADEQYSPPQGVIESRMASIWQEVLGLDRIGRQDDFFSMGGHSILGMALVRQIAEEFSVRMSSLALYESSTLQKMAQLVQQLQAEQATEDRQIITALSDVAMQPQEEEAQGSKRISEAPLSVQQEWLWRLMVAEPGSHFSCPCAYRISGLMSVERLQEALNAVIGRHSVLRTRIVVGERGPVQVIDVTQELPLRLIDLCSLPQRTSEEKARHLATAFFVEPFDLSSGPLLKAQVIKTTHREHVLLLAIHHIITDAFSISLLHRDLWESYRALMTPGGQIRSRPTLQYGDYARRQRLSDAIWLKAHSSHWRERLSNASPISWPVVRAEPARQFEAAPLQISFGEDLTNAWNDMVRERNIPPAVLTLAIFAAFVVRWCGQKDFVVPFNIAAREQAQEIDAQGYFAHLLLLRIQLCGDETFAELVQIVLREFVTAYEHIDYGRGSQERPDLCQGAFLQWLSAPTDLNDVLQLSDAGQPYELAIRNFAIDEGAIGITPLKCDVVLTFMTIGREICAVGYYRAGLFDPDFMRSFSHALLELTRKVLYEPQARLT